MGKNRNKSYDLIVIGAGASGMMAAITAARNNKNVCILEKLDKAGKKLLATGNGKCFFTNERMDTECFYGEKSFVESVLKQFSVEDCLSFFHSIGIYPKNKNGYFYPNSEQASSVVNALTNELERLGVKIYYQMQVKDITPEHDQVCVWTDKDSFVSKRVIIAAGLKAAPKLGSDGSIFDIVKSFGHRFHPILPALCGYYCKGLKFKAISGVRAYGKVSAYINGTKLGEDTGEIQFTDYGLSGIPIFQISHHLSNGLYEKKDVEIKVNLLPDFDRKQLLDELNYRRSVFATMPMDLFLNGLVNQKLSNMILDKVGIEPDFSVASVSTEKMQAIAECLQEITVRVTNYRDFEFAQVCTGGIPIAEIHTESLESKFAKNIFFTGEILDVDGICGGYNLHFAWATGHIAGKQ